MHTCHIVIQIKEPDPFPSPGKKVISPWQEGSLEENQQTWEEKEVQGLICHCFKGLSIWDTRILDHKTDSSDFDPKYIKSINYSWLL